MDTANFCLVKNTSLSDNERCFAYCSKQGCITRFTEYSYATRFTLNDAKAAITRLQDKYAWNCEIVATNERIPQLEEGFYLTFITKSWRNCKVFSYADKPSRDNRAEYLFARQKRLTDPSDFYRETTQEDLNRMPLKKNW